MLSATCNSAPFFEGHSRADIEEFIRNLDVLAAESPGDLGLAAVAAAAQLESEPALRAAIFSYLAYEGDAASPSLQS